MNGDVGLSVFGGNVDSLVIDASELDVGFSVVLNTDVSSEVLKSEVKV